MKSTGGEYVPKESIYPFIGLNTLDPSPQLNPAASPVFENLSLAKGLITKRVGYDVRGLAVNGVPQALVLFQDVAGVENVVCLTTTKQYIWGGTAWVDITGAATGWTGTVDDIVSWTVAAGTEGIWLIATNGKDKPIMWDGAKAKFELLEAQVGWAFTDFVTAKSVVSFYGYLIWGNVKRGTWGGSSVVWSEFQKLTKFNDDTQGAGEYLITDAQGELLRMVPLGDRLALYFDNSIGVLTYVGGDAIFTTEQVLQDTRLVSPAGIVNLGGIHLLMRRETISAFDGSRIPRDIGDAVYREYREVLDVSKRKQAFAFVDTGKNHVFFAVPASDRTIVYCLDFDSYDISKSTWSKHTYSRRTTAMGFFRRSSALQYNSAEVDGVDYSQRSFSYQDATIQSGFPTRLIAFADGTIGITDGGRLVDNGATFAQEKIVADYQSPDFTPIDYQSGMARWYEIELDLRGTDVEVQYSIDKGSSWRVVSTVALTGVWNRHRLTIDVVSRTLRVRLLSKTSGYFEYRWLRLWHHPREAQ